MLHASLFFFALDLEKYKTHATIISINATDAPTAMPTVFQLKSLFLVLGLSGPCEGP